ncbi:uncharacterized protein EI90DRAFT_3019288 [Cantharellus anzutake]|uniref:uncharacterized protein n=1 Tax=Cantharellus anzutake TaxID=1750568 RepID=UPI001907FEF5|nr:uncharacterized protein EI90DRAFT_3019288 [Cantharellus anzutake]KAF8324980.1 hypothetical protein EI90DRAFT_3019288 [Cantharellus anzutake]
MECMPLSPTSCLFTYLGGLLLLNLKVGEDEITSDKDYKHVMKRLRHAHLRPSGVSIGGVQITPSVLRSHLEENGCSASQINNLLNITDKQDVTTMFNLMQLIWWLPPPLATANPIFHKACIALNQHSKLLRYLILPYIDVNMSLHDQLKYLSAAAHLAYVFFTQNNTRSAYLPSLLYRDIQIMVKNAFFCVAKMKRDKPDGEFYLILLGTNRLEWIFGLIRSQKGSDVNLQGLSVAGGIEQKVDHLNPASWKGDVRISRVQLMSAWRSGRELVEHDPELATFKPAEKFNAMESIPSANLLNPFGMEGYEDRECEETHDGMPQQAQSTPSTPLIPNTLELEELVDSDIAEKHGLESTIDMGNGKHVHKAKRQNVS